MVTGTSSTKGVVHRLEGLLEHLEWDNNQGCWFNTEDTTTKTSTGNFTGKASVNDSPGLNGHKAQDAPCTHQGCVEIPFKFGNKGSRLFACSSYVADVHYRNKDLVVSFNNEDRISPVALNAHAARLLPRSEYPGMYEDSVPMVTLKWHDFDIPPVEYEFFKDLVSAMFAKKMDVLIYCMAGHGRTGTGLAAMLTAAGFAKKNKQQPNVVQWIREKYCQRAIETDAQIQWLKSAGAVVGIEQGSKQLTYSYGGY